MGWLKRKPDPINERARELKRQIADLEAQIRDLSGQEPPRSPAEAPPAAAASDGPFPPPAKPRPAPAPPPAQPQPRLRSTAYPHGRTSPPAPSAEEGREPSPESREPLFEEASRNPFKAPGERRQPEARELGVSRSDFVSIWRRFRNHWRGPATSNPKLVNYLAAGSIQGLRPLRYEKRVARNRTILLLVCLILVLWGIVAIVIRH